jgi:hypothetical protein
MTPDGVACVSDVHENFGHDASLLILYVGLTPELSRAAKRVGLNELLDPSSRSGNARTLESVASESKLTFPTTSPFLSAATLCQGSMHVNRPA